MPGQAILTIRDKQWSVSIATDPGELAQGLGGLPELPAQTGMLFDLGFAQTAQVTTAPMLFPLDIVFLSDTLVIIEVYRNIQPGYLVTSTFPARYFLEVNADELEGVDSGDRASVESPSAVVAAPDWVSAMIGFIGFVVLSIFMVSVVKDLVKGTLEGPEEWPKLLPKVMPGGGRRKGKPTRDDVRVEVWEERDRLHIGIQDKETGEYIASWWDEESREMFEQGFFKRGRELKESVLSYAEDVGLLAVLPSRERRKGEGGVMEYRVEENKPYGTWAIVEIWPSGVVRSPFKTKEEAIQREEEIGKYYGWNLRKVEFTGDELDLLEPQRFPKRTEALARLRSYAVTHVHDDGDLTVRSHGKLYVVTTEGQTFEEEEFQAQTSGRGAMLDGLRIIRAYKEVSRHSADKICVNLQAWGIFPRGRRPHILSFSPGRDHYWITPLYGHVEHDVHVPARQVEAWIRSLPAVNSKAMPVPSDYWPEAEALAKQVATTIEILPLKKAAAKSTATPVEGRPTGEGGLEYLADSPEFLTQTIDAIGYRDKINNAFQEAIERARRKG